MSGKLGIGDSFPTVTLATVRDGEIRLPAGVGLRYAVILFYRGSW